MRKFSVLLVLVLLVGVFAFPAFAQEATPEATAPATSDTDDNNDQNQGSQGAQGNNLGNQQGQVNAQQVHRVRLVYLSQDGPTLVPYVNGQPSGIQNLGASNVSGWVEFAGPIALSLIPAGGAQSQAAVGPIQLSSNFGRWTTIVVVEDAGNWNAYALRENLASIPDGCARVTVFQAVNGAATNVAAMTTNQQGMQGAQGNQQGMNQGTQANQQANQGNQMMTNLGCGGVNDQAIQGAQGDQQGIQGAQGNQQGMNQGTNQQGTTQGTQQGMNQGTTTQGSAGVGAVDCVAVVGGARSAGMAGSQQGMQGAQGNQQGMNQGTNQGTDQGTTQQGTTEGTDQTNQQGTNQGDMSAQGSQNIPMASFGNTVSNCAFTFDVPAGMQGGEAMMSIGLGAFQNVPEMTFEAGNYYFIAAYGDPANPQFVVWSTPGRPVTNLIGGAQGSQQGMQGAQGDQDDQNGQDDQDNQDDSGSDG